MKVKDFFIWCAGSDTNLLARCSMAEKNKHIGFGTLVLVPAILAFVSMSYALSTLDMLDDYPLLSLFGGAIWAFIIFSFDRFIVSTHRRKNANRKEFQSPVFFLRLFFALILGIVISHPLVMLYFNGSINDQIAENVVNQKKQIEQTFDQKIDRLEQRLFLLDSLLIEKETQRNAQEVMVSKEIDGEVIRNSQGEIITTGLYGRGPSAENKIKHLNTLQAELQQLRIDRQKQMQLIQTEIAQLQFSRDITVASYTISNDYLKKEMALEQLKAKHSIVRSTQYFLILLFVLVDILPFIFKTFSPFGMYDRLMLDDEELVKTLDNSKRREHLQKQYQEISEI